MRQLQADLLQRVVDDRLRIRQAALLDDPFLESAQRPFLPTAVVILCEHVHPPQLVQFPARHYRVFAPKESHLIKGALPLVRSGRPPGHLQQVGRCRQRLRR